MPSADVHSAHEWMARHNGAVPSRCRWNARWSARYRNRTLRHPRYFRGDAAFASATQFGDLERCSLRPGNVHSADGWRNVLEPVVMRAAVFSWRRLRLTGDIRISRSRGITLGLKANAILQRNIAQLTRPVGRPPDHRRASFSYQAGVEQNAVSWPKWSGTPAAGSSRRPNL